MKNILTIREQDIVPGSPAKDESNFRTRRAARAVLQDAKGQVYLLNVSKHDYHKLPGGGIEEGESILQGLERELMEEVGCKAEVLAELGEIVEFRSYHDGTNLKQTSYCYLAKQIGEREDSALEENELAAGMFEVKAQSIAEAINLLAADKPNNLEGKFIQKRDVAILRAALQAAKQ